MKLESSNRCAHYVDYLTDWVTYNVSYLMKYLVPRVAAMHPPFLVP